MKWNYKRFFFTKFSSSPLRSLSLSLWFKINKIEFILLKNFILLNHDENLHIYTSCEICSSLYNLIYLLGLDFYLYLNREREKSLAYKRTVCIYENWIMDTIKCVASSSLYNNDTFICVSVLARSEKYFKYEIFMLLFFSEFENHHQPFS